MDKLDFAKVSIDSVFEYILKLKNSGNFTFKPSLDGLTKEGKNIQLGLSTYGLKLYYMLGEWDNLNEELKLDWVNFINGFQTNKTNFPDNSYIDDVVFKYYIDTNIKDSIKDILRTIINNFDKYNFDTNNIRFSKTINAETKQAIATLAQVGFKSKKIYKPDPNTDEGIEKYLNSLDWSSPWNSGAQWASLCVYSNINSDNMSKILISFIDSIVDKETGSYFKKKPNHPREIINGAMKILSGLDWINSDIHYPEKLIDFCLANKPITEGCDVVDYIYVLYRCTKQTNYKKEQIVDILNDSISEIKKLYHSDSRGFSYYENMSQTTYYGVPITTGKKSADIHGTLLCTWALMMILDVNNELDRKYRIIKP